MNNFFVSIIIGLLLVGGVGGFVFFQNSARLVPSTDMAPIAGGVATTTIETETGGTTTDATLGHGGGTSAGSLSTNPGSTNSTGDTSATATPAPVSSGISVGEVAKHNSQSSCWSTINGNVYDLTSWIPKHPGGEQAILQLCGKDGSAKYNGVHGGKEKQATILAGFKVGVATK